MRDSAVPFHFALWLLNAAVCPAQPAPPPRPAGAIEVSLEARVSGAWQTIHPQTVLHSGDTIRFRFRSSSAGFLYVLSVGSGGESVSLFPRPGQTQTNRVEPGISYVIPGGNGSFSVGGKPGYDAVYWILSPGSLDFKPQRDNQPSTLEPRCLEEILKSRGLCLDERAGPSPVADIGNAPFVWKDGARPLAARDLKFQPEDGITRIATADLGDSILIYQFLVAHQ